MGNLESTEGGPGEPPSVPLLLPPGKTPMPEPCELEERFALVLVSPALLPSRHPPTPRRVPPTPAARSAPDPASNAGPGARSSPSGVGEEGSPSPRPARGPDSSPLPSDFPVACRNSIPGTSLVGRFRKLLGPQTKSGFSSRVRVGLAAIPDVSGGRGEKRTEKGLAALGRGVE